ncbi:MAG: hypothetical protein V1809_07810 [Planctomycetota bacterium]
MLIEAQSVAETLNVIFKEFSRRHDPQDATWELMSNPEWLRELDDEALHTMHHSMMTDILTAWLGQNAGKKTD